MPAHTRPWLRPVPPPPTESTDLPSVGVPPKEPSIAEQLRHAREQQELTRAYPGRKNPRPD